MINIMSVILLLWQGWEQIHTQEQEMLKHIVTVAALMLPLAAQAQPVDHAHSSGMTHVDHGADIERTREASAREPGGRD